ncbi:MAG: 3-hydroxyacyl-ACP dehydratase [candidate division Zixibacteria bacterium CG_4_9_14_3_um_filter_46_8]|nr:MAG: 3-hydroxyacyl-ACP dehydratase [candidate division Zixibacteria bacterium CG_4_9_14_3_um_filter_46_8]
MKSAGIDIGSRTIKLALIEDGEVTLTRKLENSFDTLKVCAEILLDISYDSITATGYGRHLFRENFQGEVISEITAFAKGSIFLIPSCRTILDIGGQDVKVISLHSNGKVRKFEMNDKCSAGTGRFLEIMAMALGTRLSDFGEMALSAEQNEKINSMCTVFAESEVISLLARGAPRRNVALGIHQAIVNRAKSMLHRVGIADDVVFAGGVALNPCIRSLLETAICRRAIVPDDPQTIGALGCALAGTHRGEKEDLS